MNQLTAPYQFIGNNLALDFTNTLLFNNGFSFDVIGTSDDFAKWLKKAGINTLPTVWSYEDLAKAHHLRDALKNILKEKFDGQAPSKEDVQLLNYYKKQKQDQNELIFENGVFKLEEKGLSPNIEQVLAVISESAVQLLVSIDNHKIRKCANDDCVLVFKDISKSGRRRWCSMETCGNRSKVARFRHNNES